VRSAALAAIASTGACATSAEPRLLAAMPASAPRGAEVTVSGERMCGPAHDCGRAGGQILLGVDPPQVAATIVSYTDTSAVIGIPQVAPVGGTSIVLTVDDQASNALAFEVLP
jgi:hypothetical protein